MPAILTSQDTATLADTYRVVRARTESLCEPLQPADFIVQSMPDVSPTRWHLAHVTWFFETFILKNTDEHYRPFHPRFEYLFNSYYNSVGHQFPRPRRGQMTRPGTEEIFEYRQWVDERMVAVLESDSLCDKLRQLVVLGLNHEEQHQELLLMDIKHVLFQNPLYPAYIPATQSARVESGHGGWSTFDGGLLEFGHAGDEFAFDSETPRHQAYLRPFALANQLVTNGDFLNFMSEGGYRTPTLWLSDGWDWLRREQVSAPLYWVKQEGAWYEFTLGGLVPLDLARPVSHISLYEADAYATWAEARLPTEYEWEQAASSQPLAGHFADAGEFHPRGSTRDRPLQQLFGDVWEWTRSAYQPYPGFRPAPGAVGEYNGKFMCNQMVMRGGCCATPAGHIRATYRNFFYPHMRWQFGGVRLARDT